jgi:hypothetical protein
MDTLNFLIIFFCGIFFCAGASGFCLLRIYDIFKSAIETKSRVKLWLALSASMLTLLIVIIGATGIGMSIRQRKFSPIRIPVSLHSNVNNQNEK